MTMNINFPHLGIYLENVGKSISVFGFEIAYYGMIIGLGVLSGIALAAFLAKRTGQNPDTYYDLATYAVIISIMGARLYYVVFQWEYYIELWRENQMLQRGTQRNLIGFFSDLNRVKAFAVNFIGIKYNCK